MKNSVKTVLSTIFAVTVLSLTGCDANVNINTNTSSSPENTGISESAENIKTDKADSSAETDSEADSASGNAAAEGNAASSEVPYAYPEDIMMNGVSAYENLDGSIKVLFGNGDFEATFPADWKGNFTIKEDGRVCPKKSEDDNTYGDGLLFTVRSSSEFSFAPVEAAAGYSNGQYWYIYTPTDGKYEIGSELEKTHNLLYKGIKSVKNSFRSRSESGEMTREFPVSGLKGYIGERNKYELAGYSLDSVLSGEPEVIWPVEQGWSVDISQGVYTDGNLFVDCKDSDDGDHYGWIPLWNIELKNSGSIPEADNTSGSKENDYRKLFNDKISEILNGDGIRLKYTLFDMNNDGNPELVTISGKGESDCTTSVYTALGGRVNKAGEVNEGGHSSFIKDNDTNQLCLVTAFNGKAYITRLKYDAIEVTSEKSEEFDFDSSLESALAEHINYSYVEAGEITDLGTGYKSTFNGNTTEGKSVFFFN